MREGTEYLRAVASRKICGIPSFCSANEIVLRAVCEYARDHNEHVLIECTANQVNQYGGYTGMNPADFREYAHALARESGLEPERLILGGDHLGPVVFQHLDEKEAMQRAREMIAAYIAAGFEKIHIDTSMRLRSDQTDMPLSEHAIAERAADLCRMAEDTIQSIRASGVVYVIGSEVPIPGGEQAQTGAPQVTSTQDFENTLGTFEKTFENAGLANAFDRIIAVVVQPGVEFGDDIVFDYDSYRAKSLTGQLLKHKGVVFEGHSTDYQLPDALRAMVNDGVGILKVGPELTFALREGLFALQYMDHIMGGTSDFIETLDAVMREKPGEWQKYYHGTDEELRMKRAFSFSDRWRYYAGDARVQESMRRLTAGFDQRNTPVSLVHQFMPRQYEKIRSGSLKKESNELIKDNIKLIVEKYMHAVH